MNISAAAQAIGVTPEIVRKWDDKIPTLNIPRDNAGRRRFDARSLEILQTIKKLEQQGRSLETITALLEPPAAEVMAQAPVHVLHGEVEQLKREIENLRACVVDLVEKNARLEVANTHLASELEAAEDRLQRNELMSAIRTEAPAGKPWYRFWAKG